jgi:hypothetical protein
MIGGPSGTILISIRSLIVALALNYVLSMPAGQENST